MFSRGISWWDVAAGTIQDVSELLNWIYVWGTGGLVNAIDASIIQDPLALLQPHEG